MTVRIVEVVRNVCISKKKKIAGSTLVKKDGMSFMFSTNNS